jgi:cob(I)alamin adenosyltransferase
MLTFSRFSSLSVRHLAAIVPKPTAFYQRSLFSVKIYTRTGDEGQSGLLDGSRMSKTSAVFSCLGSLDELNAAIGHSAALASQIPDHAALVDQLHETQSRLLDVGASIAAFGGTGQVEERLRQRVSFPESEVIRLEGWIDVYDDKLPPLTNFILPTGCTSLLLSSLPIPSNVFSSAPLAASFHVARGICRRSERDCWHLREENPAAIEGSVLRYVNRLSDYLFTAARWTSLASGNPDIVYKAARRKKEKTTE